jgi:hypothetical protein
VRLGVTGQRETTGTADQTLLGTDATVRLHPGTYVKAEVAQTEGPGFGQSNWSTAASPSPAMARPAAPT